MNEIDWKNVIESSWSEVERQATVVLTMFYAGGDMALNGDSAAIVIGSDGSVKTVYMYHGGHYNFDGIIVVIRCNGRVHKQPEFAAKFDVRMKSGIWKQKALRDAHCDVSDIDTLSQ